MLRHFLLALFLAILAFPAVAMPFAPVAQSDAPAAMTGHCDQMPVDGTPDPEAPAAAGSHGCIGCMVPQFAVPQPFAPVHIIAAQPVARVAHLAGTSNVPEPPPPKA